MRQFVPMVCFTLMLLLGVTGLLAVAQPGTPKAGTEITNGLGMKLVSIPPGTFLMGSPPDEMGRFDDEVQHEVEITKGFYLGKFEVTQDEYQKIAGKNASAFKGVKLPVESVSWLEAKEFCRLLSLKEGKGGKDGKGPGGYRLPTEAEWELACRAGTKTPFHFGATYSRDRANAYDAKTNEPVAVGSLAPNAWGLHDMHGNVWEWCEDFYVDYAKTAKQDPKGPMKGNGERRVARGGGWGSDWRYCRSAARMSHVGRQHANVGFRVALDIVE